MEAGVWGNSPMTDFDLDSMMADPDLPLRSPPPNHDSFESPLESWLLSVAYDAPTCSQHANKETEVLISPDLDPDDPEHRAVEMLRRMSTAEHCPIENGNLSLHPSLIPDGAAAGNSLLPGKIFVSNEFDLVDKNTLAGGAWKKYRGAMGWGIRGATAGAGFIALKRTFEFYSDNSKTNWVMDVYAKMDYYTRPFTKDRYPKYLCHVFQSNNYNPRPHALRHRFSYSLSPAEKRRLQLDQLLEASRKLRSFNERNENCNPNAAGPSTGIASENRDPNGVGPSMGIAWSNCDPNTAGPSTGIARETCDPDVTATSTGTASENCDLNASGPSTRIASGKKRKTVWDNFTEVSISNGSEGKVLTLCICNCCSMAYRKTSGTSTLAKHRCSNDYLTSNQHETAAEIRPPDMPSLVVPSCIGVVLRHDVG